MSPAVHLNVVSTCMVRALWMRARRQDKKVKMRMPPCSVDIIEWTYHSSTGFIKSLVIKSATPVIWNVILIGIKSKGKKLPGISLPCWKCSFFMVHRISCFSRLFCSAGATSAGVLPLRINCVVWAELYKLKWIKEGVISLYSPLSTFQTVNPWIPAAITHSWYNFWLQV